MRTEVWVAFLINSTGAIQKSGYDSLQIYKLDVLRATAQTAPETIPAPVKQVMV